MITKFRYNVGDILTFYGVKSINRYTGLPTSRYREVVVTKAGNFLSKICIYPKLKTNGRFPTVAKMPKKFRVKEHRRVNDNSSN